MLKNGHFPCSLNSSNKEFFFAITIRAGSSSFLGLVDSHRGEDPGRGLCIGRTLWISEGGLLPM